MFASPVALVIVPLAVLTAYVVFGLCGFGSTLIAVPLMAHFFPLQFVIPVIVLVDCVASLHQGFQLREGVNRRDLAPMLPFILAGMVAGAMILVHTPAGTLVALLGIFVTSYGIYFSFRHESVFRVARWTAAPIGLFAGTTSTVFGMAGPIYVMYLAGRGSTPDEIRATMPVIFILTTLGRIVLFAFLGLITQDALLAAALLLPAMALGLWLGNRWHSKISRAQAVRAIGVVLTLSGVSLLLRAL